MKTITVSDEVVQALDTLWIEYEEWNTHIEYIVDWHDFRPYIIGMLIQWIVLFLISIKW